MEGKENVLQELPKEVKRSSLMNKECVFYPPPERVKGSNVQKIKDGRSRQDKYPTVIDRKNMDSPKFGLKRSKPLEPSQRPLGIVKRSKPDTFINTPVHLKRSRYEPELDSVEGKCIMKPKRLKFSEECNTSLDSVDVNQDCTGLSTTYEDIDLFPNDESEKEYEELHLYNPVGSETPSSAINNRFENGLDSGYVTKGQSDVSLFRNMKGHNTPFLSNLNSDYCESIIEATEIDISNQTSQTEAQDEKPTSGKTSKRNIEEVILPPIPKKQRRLPRLEQFKVTSITKDDLTSDVDGTEASNAQDQDKNTGYDEPFDCFSSPIVSGPRKRLFSMPSQSTPNTSIGSPCNSIIRSNSRKSVSSHISRGKNSEVSVSSPISSGGDCKMSRTYSSLTRKRKAHYIPPATSTPRRISCARLQASSHESIGPAGDIGHIVTSQSSQDDLYSQDQLSEGPFSCNGSETGLEQNMLSQGFSSSKTRSYAHMSEGDHERSTVYYPESSSEPDRYNMLGDIHSFQGLEPIYQFSSMYQGSSMYQDRGLANRTNIVGVQTRYTLLGQNPGTPIARRHLNFEPTALTNEEDHVSSRSIMDPEE